MKKLIIAILVSAASSGHTAAQKIEVISATSQSWSGGVAGHHGVNYSIVIKVGVKITPDSLYTNGAGFQLPHDGYGESMITYDTVDHTYTIYASESYTDPNPRNSDPTKINTASKRPVPAVRQFEGSALLIYRYKKEKHLFVMKKTMEVLPALDYP